VNIGVSIISIIYYTSMAYIKASRLSFILWHNAALSSLEECLVLHSRSAGTLHSLFSAAFPTSGASGHGRGFAWKTDRLAPWLFVGLIRWLFNTTVPHWRSLIRRLSIPVVEEYNFLIIVPLDVKRVFHVNRPDSNSHDHCG